MSRRSIAHAKAGISVSAKPAKVYFIADQHEDPHRHDARLIKCTSKRLSRARRQAKYMHNVRLYRRVGTGSGPVYVRVQ